MLLARVFEIIITAVKARRKILANIPTYIMIACSQKHSRLKRPIFAVVGLFGDPQALVHPPIPRSKAYTPRLRSEVHS